MGLASLWMAVSFIPISHVAPCKRNASRDVPVETTAASRTNMTAHPPQATRAQVSHALGRSPNIRSSSSSASSCAPSSDVGTRTHLPRREDLFCLLLAPWDVLLLARCTDAPPPGASCFCTRIASARRDPTMANLATEQGQFIDGRFPVPRCLLVPVPVAVLLTVRY